MVDAYALVVDLPGRIAEVFAIAIDLLARALAALVLAPILPGEVDAKP